MELIIGVLIGIVLGLSIAYNFLLAKKVNAIHSMLNTPLADMQKLEDELVETGMTQDPEKFKNMKFGFKQQTLSKNGYQL